MMFGLDPVLMLTDDATVAQWNNEGLPGDKMSTQNATILTNCELRFQMFSSSGGFLTLGTNSSGLLLRRLQVTCDLFQVSAGLSSLTLSCRASSGSRVAMATLSRLSAWGREGECFYFSNPLVLIIYSPNAVRLCNV